MIAFNACNNLEESGKIFWKQAIQVTYQNNEVWHKRFCGQCMTIQNVKRVNETKIKEIPGKTPRMWR